MAPARVSASRDLLSRGRGPAPAAATMLDQNG